MERHEFTDEDLVGYLDGELSAERRAAVKRGLAEDSTLAERLDALRVDTGAISSAFDGLLTEAPDYRPLTTEPGTRRRLLARFGSLAAALVLVAALGFTAGRFSGPDEGADWRMAVAEYQLLYRTETLDHLVRGTEELESERVRVTTQLGLDIGGPLLANLEGLSYRRAQILGFEAAPLAQFAFLDGRDRPVAFCVTPSDESDRGIETNTLKGLAAASWVADGYAFLVIGDVPEDVVRRTAERLAGGIDRSS